MVLNEILVQTASYLPVLDGDRTDSDEHQGMLEENLISCNILTLNSSNSPRLTIGTDAATSPVCCNGQIQIAIPAAAYSLKLRPRGI